MARVGMESKIQFQLLVGNLKSQFMYSIKPLAYKDTFAKMTKFLTDSFFGAKSFGKALESLKSDPVLNVLIMQIYLNQYVMYNDGDTKVIQELESKLIKTIDTVGFKLMSSFEKKIAIEYVKNTPSFPSLQINSNHSPQHILKNLCILSMVPGDLLPKWTSLHIFQQGGHSQEPFRNRATERAWFFQPDHHELPVHVRPPSAVAKL